MKLLMSAGNTALMAITSVYSWLKRRTKLFSQQINLPDEDLEILGLSHDLINPVTAILLNSASLTKELKKTGYSDWLDYANNCYLAAKKLEFYLKLIKNGYQGRRAIVFSVNQEIKDIVKIFSAQAKLKNINFDLKLRANVCLNGSPLKFGQVIGNLITNAIEAYPTSNSMKVIEISTSMDRKLLKIVVTDYGCGVNTGIKNRIFKSFFSDKLHNSGIGLTISKKIINKEFGGSIKLVNNNVMTSFEILIPKK